jgi:plastocyanin
MSTLPNRALLSIWGMVALATVGVGAASSNAVDVKGTVRVGTRPQSSAVVWLDAPNAPPLAQRAKVVLHQRNLTFLPHVLAVRAGTVVDFPNEDRVFHNVFSFKDGKPFDLGIYPVGSMKRVTFSESGVTRLFCNIHPNMGGYIVTVDSPYFSAVDENGTFTLAAVPPGSYTYHAWRPGSPILTGSAIIRIGSPLEIVWP